MLIDDCGACMGDTGLMSSCHLCIGNVPLAFLLLIHEQPSWAGEASSRLSLHASEL